MKEPATEVPPTQETLVWWGSYSAWTMVPSLFVCVVLTGGVIWWAYANLERPDVRLAILGLNGIIWTVQSLRFGYRYFGCNYHLTTHRALQDWGILNKGIRTLFLKEVAAVEIARGGLEEFLGVGQIIFRLKDPKAPLMVWYGVYQPREVLERARTVLAKSAKEK